VPNTNLPLLVLLSKELEPTQIKFVSLLLRRDLHRLLPLLASLSSLSYHSAAGEDDRRARDGDRRSKREATRTEEEDI
jgi:hypothetical protein